MSIFLWILAILVAAYASFVASMLIARTERQRLAEQLADSQRDRSQLQTTLQRYVESNDTKESDLTQMGEKLARHAEEIMRLRCANESLVGERAATAEKLSIALGFFDRLESLRITTFQQITGTE